MIALLVTAANLDKFYDDHWMMIRKGGRVATSDGVQVAREGAFYVARDNGQELMRVEVAGDRSLYRMLRAVTAKERTTDLES